MNRLIKLVISYQKEKSDIALNEIFKIVKPIIKKYENKVPKFYQDDLSQEMLMRIHKLVETFKISLNNSLIINEFEKINYQTIEDDLYFKSFLKKYGSEKIKLSLNNPLHLKQLKEEYNLFCNEKQFIDCLNKRLKSTYIDFLRKYRNHNDLEIISLNKTNLDNLEIIDTVIDNTEQDINTFINKYDFTNEEIKFILSFIEKGAILSEIRVAEKLGISQQAVNKRKKKIIKKYKK